MVRFVLMYRPAGKSHSTTQRKNLLGGVDDSIVGAGRSCRVNNPWMGGEQEELSKWEMTNQNKIITKELVEY